MQRVWVGIKEDPGERLGEEVEEDGVNELKRSARWGLEWRRLDRLLYRRDASKARDYARARRSSRFAKA